MKNLKASLVLLGFTAAVLPAAALSAVQAKKASAAPAAKQASAAHVDFYGPLPPPGFKPAPVQAAAARVVQAKPAAPAGFFSRWLPWLNKTGTNAARVVKPAQPAVQVVKAPAPAPSAKPSAPAPLAQRAPLPLNARKSAPVANTKLPASLPSAVKSFGAMPAKADKIAKAVPATKAAPHAAKPTAKAPSLAHALAARTGKPQLLPSSVKAPAQTAAAPKAAEAKRAPASHGAAAPRPQFNMPVPAAPALPAAASVTVPDLQLPPMGTITINRDPLPPIKLGGRNRAELHNFSRSARLIILPTREYTTVRNAEAIAAKYTDALHPKPHQPIRTPYSLKLEKHAKIKAPPAPIQYENMVKRLDALFDGIALSYPKAIQALWDLSQSRDNAVALRARDSLFAGILSRRAHWEAVSGNLLEESAEKGLDKEARYVKILFEALEDFEAVSHIDRVIAKVNPARAKLVGAEGDKANYAMARRILLGRANPALTADDFEARIKGSLLKDRLQLMRAVAKLRMKDEGAVANLRRLEAEGHEDIRQEARLALARALLQKGEAHNALDLYKNVAKTGKNRLEVLSEQSYAELKAGLYQESLGKAVGLQSPYFQYGFSPDIHLIEVLSRKSMCDFGGAEEGLHRFVNRYGAELAGLQSTLANRANPKAFYDELIAYHAKAEPMRFQRYLLRLAPVMENQKVLNGARTELTKVGQVGIKKYTPDRPAGWDKFLAAMEKSWNRRGDVLKMESAKNALAEADYMAKRLRSTFGQAELLGLDLATSASRNFNLQSALNFPVRKLAANEVEKDKFHWPFEQEIWEDELDYLKMKNTSKCASAGARPVASAE